MRPPRLRLGGATPPTALGAGVASRAPEVAEATAATNGGARSGEARADPRAITVADISRERLRHAKVAFVARRVPDDEMQTIVSGPLRPRTGDLVLARIERIGQHARIELGTGRKARLHPGDEIVVAYGDRYASDFYEAHVPPDLGPAQLVAAGGIASRMISRRRGVRRPTEITPLGLFGNARCEPLNVSDFRLCPVEPAAARPRVLVVVGTSMNSGKTTTIRYLVHALSRGGYRPGAAKVTGTGAGNDFWMMIDAGAHRMLDFTDVGFASTYRIPVPALEQAMLELVDHLSAAGAGAILLEIADGLYQGETSELIQSDAFRDTVDAVVFAAGEAMGAAHGVARLRELGLPVVGVSGLLTASPLSKQEAAVACRLPILGIDDLSDPRVAAHLLGLEVTREAVAAGEGMEDDAEHEREIVDLLEARLTQTLPVTLDD